MAKHPDEIFPQTSTERYSAERRRSDLLHQNNELLRENNKLLREIIDMLRKISINTS
jgi:hypothetical protein